MSEFYDRQGQPLTLKEWAEKLEDYGYKVVDKTLVGDMEVSTVWLGLDHSWGHGPPLIFETMIFGDIMDQECWRYSTEEEARAGHAEVVTWAELAQRVEKE